MASFYGANSTLAFNTVPSQKVDVTNWFGKERVVYDSYTVPTAAPANADKIYLGKLPKGAKVGGGRLTCSDLGTVGVLNVGYEYVNSADGSAVTNAFFASVDVHTAASDNTMAGTAAGYMVELAGEAYIVATITTAWDATSGSIQCRMIYTLE